MAFFSPILFGHFFILRARSGYLSPQDGERGIPAYPGSCVDGLADNKAERAAFRVAVQSRYMRLLGGRCARAP